MNFHIYENDHPTKGVFNTFEEAKSGAKIYLDGESRIEIRTINSSDPLIVWKYDYKIQRWVEQT